jgi:RNA polymerase sigma-70 factor (ECF subfamily)
MGAMEAGNGTNGERPTSLNGQVHWAEQEHWLRAVVAARLGESQGVEEVLQEIALQTVRQPATWAAVTYQPGWLYRVAVRQCMLYRRRHGRQRKLLSRYAQRQTCADHLAEDPLAWLLSGERLALVRLAISRLPTRDAEFLLLKYSQDCSYAQIAEQLGTTTSAVEARLHRARERLRRELRQLDPWKRDCDEQAS